MSRGPGIAALVERVLTRDAAACGVQCSIVAATMRPWASVTFTGARHCLTIAGEGGAAVDQWLASLPERNLPVAGHLIADVVVAVRREDGARFEAEIEVLSVEER